MPYLVLDFSSCFSSCSTSGTLGLAWDEFKDSLELDNAGLWVSEG